MAPYRRKAGTEVQVSIDSFRKIVVTRDKIKPRCTENGILTIDLSDLRAYEYYLKRYWPQQNSRLRQYE